MFKIATMALDELEGLFQGASEELNMDATIIEKDFWVCWTLAYLFQKSKWKDNIVFKGGTSLSKCYNLISRFSEDIDLILDWRLLKYQTSDVLAARSKTKDDEHVVEMNRRGARFIGGEFIETLREDFSTFLPGKEFTLTIDKEDQQTIIFSYPKTKSSFHGIEILDVIRLEMGANAAWSPSCTVNVKPYIAQVLNERMDTLTFAVNTTNPRRTFWEKATILHKEAHRVNGYFPPRYARHYYDLYKLCNSFVKQDAFNDLQLLSTVVDFKSRFYKCTWAKYEDAKPGTMKLIPQASYLNDIETDYEKTKSMLYGDVPSFKEIMDCIAKLEMEINTLK